MKTIGFVKERDNKIIKREYLDNQANLNFSITNKIEKEKVVDYLINSEKVFSITLSLFDDEKYIGPYTIYSDGEWLWPSHFPYFLEKNDFINNDFLNHVRNKNYETFFLTQQRRQEVVSFLEKTLLNV